MIVSKSQVAFLNPHSLQPSHSVTYDILIPPPLQQFPSVIVNTLIPTPYTNPLNLGHLAF